MFACMHAARAGGRQPRLGFRLLLRHSLQNLRQPRLGSLRALPSGLGGLGSPPRLLLRRAALPEAAGCFGFTGGGGAFAGGDSRLARSRVPLRNENERRSERWLDIA